MADRFDPAFRSEIMRKVKSKNTSPELKVRRALHTAGFRFRLHRKDLPGQPDIVLPRYRMAVFVHGCFWHGHDCKRGARIPATNVEYWTAKIDRNRRRDVDHARALRRLGWRRRVVWECEAERATARLIKELLRLRDKK